MSKLLAIIFVAVLVAISIADAAIYRHPTPKTCIRGHSKCNYKEGPGACCLGFQCNEHSNICELVWDPDRDHHRTRRPRPTKGPHPLTTRHPKPTRHPHPSRHPKPTRHPHPNHHYH